MGCVNSVGDKKAAGTLSQSGQSGAWQADAAAAVAQLLGPGAAAHVEIAVKCRGLPNRDVLRCGGLGAPSGRALRSRRASQQAPRPASHSRCPLPRRATPRSKSNAMAVLLASDGYKSERWSEVGRTDTVANSLDPEFRKPLRATYQVRVGGAHLPGISICGALEMSVMN